MSVKKNFIYNLLYQMLIIILPIITTPYISRVISVEGVGIQSYWRSIANYFVLFAMLGINNHGNRSIASNRENKENLSKVFWSIYIFQIIMSALMIFVYLVYIILGVKENKTIAVIQLIYIVAAMLDINWFFFGMEEFKITVTRNTIIKVLSTCSIFIFVKSSKDLYLYSLILALSTLISQITLWFYIKRFIKFIRVKWSDIYKQIKPNLVLFIPVVAVSIYKIMDKIMLGSMSNMIEVGYYENSEKIINIPMGIIVALGTVMLPKMSNLQARGQEEEGKRYILLSIQFVMFLSIGSVAGLIGVGPKFIPLFLGLEFKPCVEVVSLLAITLLFMGWANVIRTQYLIPKQLDKIYIISTILGAIVNLIINILLIKKYGAIGAAIGTIFAEGVVAIYQTVSIRKKLDIKIYVNRVAPYLISGIIMCIFVRWIGNVSNLNIIIVVQIIIGILVYSTLSLIYIVLSKNELYSMLIDKISKL